MRIWFGTVIILFLGIQVYQWLKGFMLPLPIYVMAAAFLALASNYEKGLAPRLKPLSSPQISINTTTVTVVEEPTKSLSPSPESINSVK